MPKVTVIQLLDGKTKTMDIRYANILVRLGRVRFQDLIVEKALTISDETQLKLNSVERANIAPENIKSEQNPVGENVAGVKNSETVKAPIKASEPGSKQKAQSKTSENSQEK
jgi:hypothetical protein